MYVDVKAHRIYFCSTRGEIAVNHIGPNYPILDIFFSSDRLYAIKV